MCALSRSPAPLDAAPQALHRALRRLGALDRIIVDLHVRDGLSFRTIAERLGRAPGTVSRRWYERILPALRHEVVPSPPPIPPRPVAGATSR